MILLTEDTLTCAYDKESFEKYKEYISLKNKELYAAFVKVDNFKEICGIYSIPTADNCLIITAARLKKVNDKLFRVSGDSFVLLIYSKEEMDKFKEMLKLIPTLYFESGKSILSVNVGISDKGCSADIDMLVEQAKQVK